MTDECPVGYCFEAGVCYCIDLNGEPTIHRTKCFVRISDTDDQGQSLAHLGGCDAGCLPCEDFPSELIRDAMPLMPGGTATGGTPRFLQPLTPNARGLMGDLRGHQPQLTQQRMVWERAACLHGAGYECLTDDEVPCECWPGPPEFIGAGNTCGVVVLGHVIKARQSEGFFYFGDWPHTAERWNIDCRKFPHHARRSVSMHSPAGNTLFLTTTIEGSGCATDWQVPGCGRIVDEPTCSGRFANSIGLPEGPYINHSNAPVPCRGLFDRIYVKGNTTRFRQRGGLDPDDVALHDAILAKVRTPDAFANLEGGGDPYVNFDQLDHEGTQGNAGLGRYTRAWNGTALGIHDTRLPVVETYPETVTRWGRIPAPAELVIVAVSFNLDLALPHSRKDFGAHALVDWIRKDYIEPHAVLRIMVWLGLRVDIPEAIYTPGNIARWPDITPEGNSLMIAKVPHVLGQKPPWRRPPPYVEWRGQLNHFSEPSIYEQGYPAQVGGDNVSFLYGEVLKKAVRDLGDFVVPGTPVHRDHNPADQNQHWDGQVRFTFAAGTSFHECYPNAA